MLEWSFSARRAGPATLEHGQKSVVDESNSVIILHLYRVADRREKKIPEPRFNYLSPMTTVPRACGIFWRVVKSVDHKCNNGSYVRCNTPEVSEAQL